MLYASHRDLSVQRVQLTSCPEKKVVNGVSLSVFPFRKAVDSSGPQNKLLVCNNLEPHERRNPPGKFL